MFNDAPTNDAEEDVKEEFYQLLQGEVNKVKNRDMVIVMGDFNAKVGSTNSGYETVMGRPGVGTMNENGERFANCCLANDLVFGGTVFPHRLRHKITWMSPDAVTENQIDHLCVCRKFRRSLLDVRVKRGADAASDHHLLTAKIQLKLKRMDQVKVAGDRVRFCVDRLKEREIEQIVQT